MKRIMPWLVTIHLLAIPLFAAGQESKIHSGDIDGAPFRIDMPGEWNGTLVMYAHGYLPGGVPWRPLSGAFVKVFLDRGFALAQSGYAKQGWAVEEGFRDTEALRVHFVKTFGMPKRCFITGHSMGAFITLATIESYPGAYDGAMPMGGPLQPALRFFGDQVLDLLVTFNGLFGEHLPEGWECVITGNYLRPDQVERALAADEARAADFSKRWDIRRKDLARNIAFFQLIYKELMDRAGGNPVDNRNTVYSGFGPIEDLNAKIPRFAADPKAVEYLVKFYTPTGRLEDPVLALHTIYDPGVPPRLANAYHVTATLAGCGKLFTHKYVKAEGHCNIAPELMGKGLDELVQWAVERKPPKHGVIE